jgi:hypothetical protein
MDLASFGIWPFCLIAAETCPLEPKPGCNTAVYCPSITTPDVCPGPNKASVAVPR